jgi:hypothetical protein
VSFLPVVVVVDINPLFQLSELYSFAEEQSMALAPARAALSPALLCGVLETGVFP